MYVLLSLVVVYQHIVVTLGIGSLSKKTRNNGHRGILQIIIAFDNIHIVTKTH